MTQAKAPDPKTTYGIGATARLTGISVHTIRIWERRYQAVVAQRGENGRRYYLPADVEKLRLLKDLTGRGIAIGTIANLATKKLRERTAEVEKLRAIQTAPRVSVGIFGDFLPARLVCEKGELGILDIVLAETSLERFKADLLGQKLEALILEMPIVDAGTTDEIRRMQTACGADRAVVVYGFGRHDDVKTLQSAGVGVLRSPVTLEELEQAVSKRYLNPAERSPTPSHAASIEAGTGIEPILDPPAPRLFSREQLSALSQTATNIQCECPKHLVELVNDLTAFEIYSSDCTSRSPEDAKLHAYLHSTTAKARALIEEALDKVVRTEGLLDVNPRQ